LPISAAVENGDVAVVGDLVPEPLQVVLVPFLVVGGADGVDPVGAGVELLCHAPDGAALASGVTALEDDHRPLAVVVAGSLQALQTGLEVLEAILVSLGVREAEAEVDLAEFGGGSGHGVGSGPDAQGR